MNCELVIALCGHNYYAQRLITITKFVQFPLLVLYDSNKPQLTHHNRRCPRVEKHHSDYNKDGRQHTEQGQHEVVAQVDILFPEGEGYTTGEVRQAICHEGLTDATHLLQHTHGEMYTPDTC